MSDHSYALDVIRTGSLGTGTSGPRDYDRGHTLSASGKPDLHGSADHPSGRMHLDPDGSGQFVDVVLEPQVTVADESMSEAARDLHDAAHGKCFIARSVNFSVRHRAEITTAGAPQ